MNVIPIEFEENTVIPDMQNDLLEIGKMYLKYFTWDKIHIFMFPPPTLRSFQEILEQEFDGNLDEAMTEFLIPEMFNITTECLLFWMSEHSIVIQNTPRELLGVIKHLVRSSSLDELKFVCDLEEISLK